LAAKIK